MVKNDASGKPIGYKPGKSIDLVRNPNWDKSTDYRPAYAGRDPADDERTDASVAARQVLTART